LQQSTSFSQSPPVLAQPHVPLLHVLEQQSLPPLHESPSCPHVDGFGLAEHATTTKPTAATGHIIFIDRIWAS